jgi:CRP-like cAMP-binding protein
VDRARDALMTVMQDRSLAAGEALFRQGETPCAMYFLRSGLVHLERPGGDLAPGLCVARPGDVIGVTYAVSGRPYDMDAVATKASTLEVVPREEFLRLMTSAPGLHLEVVRLLSIDLGRCYEVFRSLGPKTRSRHTEAVTL